MSILESDDIVEILKNSTKKTQKFSLEGQTKLCKVEDVYDGDTCRVVFNHNGKIKKWNVRMVGYDTPEMKPSRSNPNRDTIKQKAKESRDYLKSLIANENDKLVYLKCGKFDKYGRLLGYVYIKEDDTESVNEMMIKNNHAYEYHGGTKKV